MKTSVTGRVARAAATKPWITISVWIVALAAAIVAAGGLGDALTQEELFLTETESQTARDISDRERGVAHDDDTVIETVVVTAADARFGDSSFTAALASLTNALAEVDGVESVTSPTVDQPFPVSEDGSAALVTMSVTPDDNGLVVEDLVSVATSVQAQGFDMRLIGPATAGAAYDTLAEESLIRGEAIGIGVALIILLVVFGAFVAAGIPLLIAIVSISMALGATAIVGQITSLSFFVINMLTMMGLALGIDYSLFAVQRFREELRHEHSVVDAVAITGATANRAVLFSGITVVISLLGLLIVPSTIMRSLGTGAIVVAIMSVVAASTLLPAVLALLGHRVNKGRVPFTRPGAEPRRWQAIAEAVSRRPVVWATAGLVVLALLAAPALSMRLAFPGIEALPEDHDLRIANASLTDDFGQGQSRTFVAIENASGAATQVQALATIIESDPAFSETTMEWSGTTAFIDTRDVYDSADPLAEQAIARLRDELAPSAFAGTDAVPHVGGDQAYAVDFSQMIRSHAPWVLLLVLGSSFGLLLVAFRSLVVPAVAIALNLVSAAAAFGIMVAVFQWGWGTDWLGFSQVDGIAPWIPLFLFAVLFGLSMDYHVFLLSRIKERYDITGHTREAIGFGLSRTGSLITGAALIMVAVFGGFALGDLTEFAQMGFGLAVAVILDATVVRGLLVPALMTVLGRANWYLPRRLEWLPHVNVEGTAHEPVRTGVDSAKQTPPALTPTG